MGSWPRMNLMVQAWVEAYTFSWYGNALRIPARETVANTAPASPYT